MDADGPGRGAPRTEDGPPLTLGARWSALRLAVTVIGSFLAAVVVSTAIAVALGIGRRAAQQRSAEEILFLALLSDGALLVALALLGRRLLALRAADLGLRRPSLGSLGFAASAAGGLWLLSILANILQIRAFGQNPQSLIVSVGAHTGPVALFLDLVTGAVVAPFAEEILFRGLIFGGLAQRMPVAAAAAASALLFAVSHGLGVVVPIFVLGVGLAYVYARAGTIWAPMVTHGVVNAVSLLLVFAGPKP